MLKFSRMMDHGTTMPSFRLPDTSGRIWANDEFSGEKGVVVAFICNHCPFVLHIIGSFSELATRYQKQGIRFVAISSNDPSEYPEDSYEKMGEFAERNAFTFPYLYDETQDVALAFNAICTPDFFVFDEQMKLFYTGQYDESRPHTGHPPLPGAPPQRTGLPATGSDLAGALDALLSGAPSPKDARPSAGCSIKWRQGKAPTWG